MSIILCATRGGEASNRTQDKAIALAKERGDTLLFLNVVDLQFLDKTAAPIVVDIADEVLDLCEFILLMVKERAAEQNVEAETLCVFGNVREVLKEIAARKDVSLVVLGRPAGVESAFKLADLEAFAAEIEEETKTKTVIV